jgi:hypothetical protein
MRPMVFYQLINSPSPNFWVWDGDQTRNGVLVHDWDSVPGQENIPVPSVP